MLMMEVGGRKSFQIHTLIDSSPILLGRKLVLVLPFLLMGASVLWELPSQSTLNFCYSGAVSIFSGFSSSLWWVWQYFSFTSTDKNKRKICGLKKVTASCCASYTHTQPYTPTPNYSTHNAVHLNINLLLSNTSVRQCFRGAPMQNV